MLKNFFKNNLLFFSRLLLKILFNISPESYKTGINIDFKSFFI